MYRAKIGVWNWNEKSEEDVKINERMRKNVQYSDECEVMQKCQKMNCGELEVIQNSAKECGHRMLDPNTSKFKAEL